MDSVSLVQGGLNAVYMLIDDVSLTSCFSLEVNSHKLDNINIYPNPTSESVVLDLGKNIESQTLSLKILNIHGQTLFSKKNCKKSTQVDISSFPDGVYFVQFRLDDLLTSKKMIIR